MVSEKVLGKGRRLTVSGVGNGAARIEIAKAADRMLLENFMAAVERKRFVTSKNNQVLEMTK
jgi:hypothetical protein